MFHPTKVYPSVDFSSKGFARLDQVNYSGGAVALAVELDIATPGSENMSYSQGSLRL